MALGNSETGEGETKVEVHQTTPPTYACAVCHLELRAEIILACLDSESWVDAELMY